MKNKMLIRKNDCNELGNRMEQNKYYVCYAIDGAPVSSDSNYQFFGTIAEAKKYIIDNEGIFVKE